MSSWRRPSAPTACIWARTTRPRRRRAVLGADAIIGVSCYDSLERAQRCRAAGASYVSFGAFFASPTKPLGHARLDRPAEAKRRAGHATGGDRRHHAGQWRFAGRSGRRFPGRRSPPCSAPDDVRAQPRAASPTFYSTDIEIPHDDQPRTLPARAAADARRREFAGARVQVGRRRAVLHRSAPTAPICGTSRARATSTTSAPGVR